MKVSHCFALLSAFMLAGSAFAQMAEPPAELKALDWMIGEWSGTTTWEIPGTPKSESPMSWKASWNGPFLHSVSLMEQDGMKMTEEQFLTYDIAKKEFISWTFTNFGSLPRVERGKIEGNKFVSVSDPWDVHGQTIIGRVTMEKKGDGEQSLLLEFKMGENWTKVSWGTFKKKT